MKRLLVYLEENRKEAVLGPLFKMVEALLELVVPLLVAAMIDQGIANRDTGYILRMGLTLLGVGIVGLSSSLTAQYFAAKAAVGFGVRIRRALFEHIQRFSYTEMDTVGAPVLINRMTADALQVQTGVNMTLRLLLRSPFIVFGAMIMACTVSPRAAAVFVPLIAALSVVVAGIMALTLPKYKVVQGKLDRLFISVRETLTGVRVLRAFGREGQEVKRFTGEADDFYASQNKVGKQSALMNPLTSVLANGALLALLWSGAVQVQAGSLSQGQVVALVSYLSQILVELIKLANLLVTMTKSLACAKRIEAVFEIEPSMKEIERPKEMNRPEDMERPKDMNHPKGVERPKDMEHPKDMERPEGVEHPKEINRPKGVEFAHVSFRYQGAGENSLTDISFTAHPGEMIGVIGGTGSGKTTLVNLIPRFYDATEGAVRVDGVDVKEQSLEALRGKCAVVPQKAALFSGTIAENLRWGSQDAPEQALWQALEIAQASKVVQDKPGELQALVEQNARNLSGGQKQRLTIARALVMDAPILILDDSASALDFATDAALRRALKEACRDKTVFVVSQRASSVRTADRILVLEDGHLAGSGSHDQLMENCEVYREIYFSQYPEEAKP